MKLARLNAVFFTADDQKPSSFFLEITHPELNTFEITVSTTPALFDAAKKLTATYHWQLHENSNRNCVVFTFRLTAETFEAAVNRVRELYGAYFTMGAPHYCYDAEGVTIIDLVPGDHTFVNIQVEGESVLLLNAIKQAVQRGDLELAQLPEIDDYDEIRLRLNNGQNYLSAYAEIAALFGG
jgi:hypothetical protein